MKAGCLFRKGVTAGWSGTLRRGLTAALAACLLFLVVTPQAMAIGAPAGESISNRAYVDYEDTNGNPLDRVYSNTVETVIAQVAAVRVEPPTAAHQTVNGDATVFAVTVHNDGNGTDTFDLTQLTTAPQHGPSWTITVVNDEDGDGVYDPLVDVNVVTDTGALDADGVKKVFVVVQTSGDPAVQDGDFVVTDLTATSQYTPGVSDTGVYTTTVRAASLTCVKTVQHTDTNGDGEIDPGETLTFIITGNNNGSASSYEIRLEDVIPGNTTYVPGSMKAGTVGAAYNDPGNIDLTDSDDTDNWNDTDDTKAIRGKYESGNDRIVIEKKECEAGGSGRFFFQVTVDAGTLRGVTIENQATTYFTLIPNGTEYQSDSNEATVTVGYFTSILLDPDRAGSFNPGDQVAYPFTVTNNGNAPDTVNLTGFTNPGNTSTQGWNWVIWVDVDGNNQPGTGSDYILTVTNGVATTPQLAANGGSIKLIAVTAVPAGTNDGTVCTTTITGTSLQDGTVTDPEVLTTTVTAPNLSIEKIVTPTGSQPPGTILTYTVTVTNNGTGQATAVVIADAVPLYTEFVSGSIKTGATAGTLVGRSDAVNGDGGGISGGTLLPNGNIEGGTILAPDGGGVTLGFNSTWILEFKVKIKED